MWFPYQFMSTFAVYTRMNRMRSALRELVLMGWTAVNHRGAATRLAPLGSDRGTSKVLRAREGFLEEGEPQNQLGF